MRPICKTWLTICLLTPLAAHADNREQHLHLDFAGHTTKLSTGDNFLATNSEVTKKAVARPASSKAHRRAQSNIATASPASANNQSSTVLNRAIKLLGTPYRWGGSSPSEGFDCSGLVKYVFSDVATIDLPRTSNEMASSQGKRIERRDLKPGDLLFFNIKSRKVNHVAIYLGNNRFIHAPRRGKSVTIDSLKKPYWQTYYAVAKRILPKEKTGLRVVPR